MIIKYLCTESFLILGLLVNQLVHGRLIGQMMAPPHFQVPTPFEMLVRLPYFGNPVLLNETQFIAGLQPGFTIDLAFHRSEGIREFDIYIPENITSNPALVVDVHSLHFNRKIQQKLSGWKELADETNEFVVVWPQGYDLSWNGITCCSFSQWNNIDDAGFIKEMIAEIKKIYDFDPNRVYASGYSNGAQIVNRLGYLSSDIFAAIATNGFHLDDELYEEAIELRASGGPAYPISVLAIHGYRDRADCWEDDCLNWKWLEYFTNFKTDFSGGKHGWHKWAHLNNCTSDITTIATESDIQNHEFFKWIKAYETCAEGTEVRQILNSRGHSIENAFAKNGGLYMSDYTEYTWNFFKRFSLDGAL